MNEDILVKSCNGCFTIIHKRIGFGQESYSPKSVKGVLNILENILAGYKPDPADVYRKDDAVVVHTGMWKEPQLLD